MRKTLIPILIAAVALLGGCKNLSTREEGTLIGAGAGAGLGALIGAASGSWAWGAVIGAGAGALGGYVISDSIADEEERAAGQRGRNYETSRSPQDEEAITRRNQAETYFQQALRASDDSQAEYYLQKSLDLYPTAEAYNNMGLLRLRRGDRGGAEDAWNRALALDPDFRAARDNLARMHA